jgi:hypothetical protein
VEVEVDGSPIVSALPRSPADNEAIAAILVERVCVLSAVFMPLLRGSSPERRSDCVPNDGREWGNVFVSAEGDSSASWVVARACVNREDEFVLRG